ncbi:MAG TPA: hypothetical protein VFO89_16295 [Thermoanaerobaculia bacterium]|nr:hypothetical protein [Thermoanaerobaculia bacterium]
MIARPMISPLPLSSALIVGHPGHELRLFRWLESARPLVCVITDGSGSGRSRIASSLHLLAASGSTAGPVMGPFTDAAIYETMLRGDIAPVVEVVESIAEALAARRVQCVVADAFEFYNPTHDLCSIVATLAARRAEAIAGLAIDRYDYAVTVAASGSGIELTLSESDVERKLAAAYAFENLTKDVNDLLALVGRDELAREILRPVSAAIELPSASRKPFYETHGEERVAAGRYRTVLRYDEHFVPFVEALAAAFGQSVRMEAPAAQS